jgi:hypothetical protein
MAKSRKSLPKQRRTRGRSRYRHTEITRLLKGAIGAGLKVRGLEADPDSGKLRVLVDKPEVSGGDDLDQWVVKKAALRGAKS